MKKIPTYTMTAVGSFILSGFSRQHCDLGTGLLDELLQINLPQLLSQLLQLMVHVLQRKSTDRNDYLEDVSLKLCIPVPS